MKKIVALLLSINSAFSHSYTISDYEKKIKNLYSVKNLVEKISKKELEDSLREFVIVSRPNRFYGSTGNLKAQVYINNYLLKLNSERSKLIVQEFLPDVSKINDELKEKIAKDFSKNANLKDTNAIKYKNFLEKKIKTINEIKNIKSKNIIWEKQGTEFANEVITIFSNIDTLNLDQKNLVIETKLEMPGADRNASGVMLALNMANLINQLDLKRTIRFVFLDGEELNNLGSRYYFDHLNNDQKNLLGLNLFMLGNDTKIKDSEQKMGNFKAYMGALADTDLELKTRAQDFLKIGKNAFSYVEFKIDDEKEHFDINLLAKKAKFPLLTLSENWETDLNPRQQTADDFVETLNFQTFINCYKNITAGLLGFSLDIVK